jgi:hypothetical protein
LRHTRGHVGYKVSGSGFEHVLGFFAKGHACGRVHRELHGIALNLLAESLHLSGADARDMLRAGHQSAGQAAESNGFGRILACHLATNIAQIGALVDQVRS